MRNKETNRDFQAPINSVAKIGRGTEVRVGRAEPPGRRLCWCGPRRAGVQGGGGKGAAEAET